MAMKIGTEDFKERVNTGINNSFMRGAVSGAQERLQTRRLDAAAELGNWEEWRSLAEEIRKHVLENLDYYLYQLSENVVERGGHVYFAETAEEASSYISEVIEKKKAKKVVKSKSMVTEEIHLNACLEKAGCEVIETDLGEYILQWTTTIPHPIS
jgi:L-lactate dehydrogenase complex protein LldF